MEQLHVSNIITLDRCSTSRETRRQYMTWKRQHEIEAIVIKFPAPLNTTMIKFPPPGKKRSQMPGYARERGGGCVEASI